MGASDRQQYLLGTDRWRALGTFVHRWYARPLSEDDGHTPLEIESAARRLGTPLPVALAEWFELVGRRLQYVQDAPRLLHIVSIENGMMRVWTENQGVWAIVTPVESGDDPLCEVDEHEFVSPDAVEILQPSNLS